MPASAPAPTSDQAASPACAARERFTNYWQDDVGHADQIEIIVINDATARMAALCRAARST